MRVVVLGAGIIGVTTAYYVAKSGAEVTVLDDEILAYYDDNPDEFNRPALAHLSYLTVSRQPVASDSAATLERAVTLKAELDAGADFAALARVESADSISAAAGGADPADPPSPGLPRGGGGARLLGGDGPAALLPRAQGGTPGPARR